MVKKIKMIGFDEKVPVKLSVSDRDLIVCYTLAGPDLTDRLERANAAGSWIIAQYTLAELDELLGFIAAEANHARTRKLQRQLDKLYDRLKIVEGSYADELSPEWLQQLAT